jgi:probable rRNA maturation factor
VISFHSEDCSRPKIRYLVIKQWIKKIACDNDVKIGDIIFIFCSDQYILTINKEYLNHYYSTDIITFNYNKFSIISGDIFISIDTVKENALLYSVTYEQELLRVIIHGILHLIGFDDTNDELQTVMTAKEDEALELYFKNFVNK